VRPAVARGDVGALARKVNWGGGPPLAAVELDHLRRLYDGEVRAWDAALGRLVAALRDLDVLDTTVVVMTADHGEAFQEHGRLKHGGDLYEELLRVPLVVAGPGIASGRRQDQAQGIDVFPTVAGLLGFAPPPGLPGRDLLRTGEARPAISETRYGPGPDGGATPLVSLRQPPWKLIHAPAAGRFELYDLARDPGERDDRFGAAPEGARLAALLAGWQAAAAPPSVAGQDPALRERLRALGYVQ
jgi:arylsulfatase A-like enzyme